MVMGITRELGAPDATKLCDFFIATLKHVAPNLVFLCQLDPQPSLTRGDLHHHHLNSP